MGEEAQQRYQCHKVGNRRRDGREWLQHSGPWMMISCVGASTYVGEGHPQLGGMLELFALVAHTDIDTGHVMFK